MKSPSEPCCASKAELIAERAKVERYEMDLHDLADEYKRLTLELAAKRPEPAALAEDDEWDRPWSVGEPSGDSSIVLDKNGGIVAEVTVADDAAFIVECCNAARAA